MFSPGASALTEIAVLVCAPRDEIYAAHLPPVLARLKTALAPAGLVVAPTPWTDHVEDATGLAGSALVLAVLAWGYHRDHDRWLTATRTWAAAGVRIANPPSVLGWNSDKTYLRRLEASGVPIPATLWSDGLSQTEVEAAFDRFATDTLIVKPTVSGGAWKTVRLSRGEDLIDPPLGAAMIQPFLPELVADGELSLLFFEGRFSHAVLKRVAEGEFRVQVQYGGGYSTVAEPPAEAMALALRVLAAVEEPLLYARIDMVRATDGRWLLMEAELIEPDFYLAEAPDRGGMFAEAVRARVDAG